MQQIASFISVMLYICCLYIFGVLRVQILTMEPKECARWRWNVHQVTEQPSSSHMQPAITMVHPSKMDRSQKSSFTLRYDRRMNQKQNNGCVIQLTDTPNPADDSLANLFNYLVRTFFHFLFSIFPVRYLQCIGLGRQGFIKTMVMFVHLVIIQITLAMEEVIKLRGLGLRFSRYYSVQMIPNIHCIGLGKQ